MSKFFPQLQCTSLSRNLFFPVIILIIVASDIIVFAVVAVDIVHIGDSLMTHQLQPDQMISMRIEIVLEEKINF